MKRAEAGEDGSSASSPVLAIEITLKDRKMKEKQKKMRILV